MTDRKDAETAITERDILRVDWSVLRQHLERDGVIVVSPELDLVTVASKVAEDDKPVIQAWVQNHLISKPTPEQLDQWEKNQDWPFVAIIIQPFVLVQEKPFH